MLSKIGEGYTGHNVQKTLAALIVSWPLPHTRTTGTKPQNMALPSLRTTVHTIAQLLVVVAATTATWAIGDERRGSMFNWDLTQTGLFSSDANRGVLPGKIVPQPANGPRFGKLPPHALRFSGDQQQVEVAKPVDPKTTGRVEIDKALNRDAKLVALSAKTGKIAWEQLVDYAAIEHHLYALYSDDILVTVGSRNQPRGKKDQSQVWYDLHAYDANTGKLLWEKSQNNQTAAGGDHGEQDHHPVLVGNRLFGRTLCLQPADWGARERLAVASGTSGRLWNGFGIGRGLLLPRLKCSDV